MSISDILKAAGIILIGSISQMSGIIESTKNGKAAIVNIYSEFCGYSHKMADVYANYVPITANKNINFYGADANDVDEIKADQGITGVPTFIGFACGKEVNRVIGADKDGLSELLTKLGNVKC